MKTTKLILEGFYQYWSEQKAWRIDLPKTRDVTLDKPMKRRYK